MTTACPCFGTNENCRLCGGSGCVSPEVEAKIARKQQSVQTSHFSGQPEPEKLEALSPAGKKATKIKKEQAAKTAAERAAKDAEQAAMSIAHWKRLWAKR